jgi:hypothetical protein
MENIGPFCKNCNHDFKWHEQSFDDIWFCDFENEFGDLCNCAYFASKRAAGTDGDEIEVQYDSESYRWN